MSKLAILETIKDLIGNTPIVRLSRLCSSLSSCVFVKLEYLNPTGSHKDRIAFYMVRDIIERGLVSRDVPIIEASSGNTAISVAWICNLLELECIIVLPETVSETKKRIVKLLGAKVVEVPKGENYIEYAKKLANEVNGIFLNQYANEANIKAHYETTGPEIWSQLKGNIDIFVMGVGTGGTVIGVGKFLKERKKDCKIVAVIPKGSPILGGSIGEEIDGLAYDIVPDIYEKYRKSVVDLEFEVTLSEALSTLRQLIKFEGIIGGPSTGANVYAALKLAREEEKKNIVTLAPDSIFKYLDKLNQLEVINQV